MFKGNKMGWIWGSKTSSPQPISFTARQREGDECKQKVRMALELEVDYPQSIDIVDSLINTHITFDVPMGVNIADVKLTNLDLLEYVNRVEL
jgi:hypothetical protein